MREYPDQENYDDENQYNGDYQHEDQQWGHEQEGTMTKFA